MRLQRFYVQRYRLLNELTLNFERPTDGDWQGTYALDFLAGVNGTGKSTVLRLLGQLFAALDAGEPAFVAPVELEYTIGDGHEMIDVCVSTLLPDSPAEQDAAPSDDAAEHAAMPSVPDYSFRYKTRIHKQGQAEDAAWTPLDSQLREELLPVHVVMYTSGDERTWYEQMSQYNNSGSALSTTDRSTAAESDDPVLQERLLFLLASRLPAVTLCGLLASRQGREGQNPNTPEVLHEVLSSLSIAAFTGFSLRCRVHQGVIHPLQMRIIRDLAQCADRVVQQGADYLLIFDLAQHDPTQAPDAAEPEMTRNIYRLYKSPLQLFQNLNILYEHKVYEDAPLQAVNLFFKRTQFGDTSAPVQLYDWLSDGERSFLARMALFALARTNNILILLDEPEVHFNDIWKREIVNTLHQMMQDQRTHALITTHSGITLTDVPREHVLVMGREGAQTSEHAGKIAPVETLGADPSDVIVHVFGTQHPSGSFIVSEIRRRIGSAQNTADLEKLSRQVAPGYWRYRIQLEIARMQRARR